MKRTPSWEAALRAELQRASARSYQRLMLADPWHRALTCCVTAQRIREKRTRQTTPRRTSSVKNQPAHWDGAFKIVIQEAVQRARRRQGKGSWDHALKLKLTAWRMRAQSNTPGTTSAPPK